jgi:hypothetical protein
MAIQGVRHGLTPRGSHNVKIELEGQWVKFNELVRGIDKDMALAAGLAQKKFAENYRDKVKENIANHGIQFGYPPLEQKYIKRKTSAGGSSGALTWSNAMHNSVKIVSSADKRRWMVGIPKGLRRRQYDLQDENTLAIHEYANVMEHGLPARNVPARPVFSDTFRRSPSEGGVGGKNALKRFIEVALASRFGSKGIIVTKI